MRLPVRLYDGPDAHMDPFDVMDFDGKVVASCQKRDDARRIVDALNAFRYSNPADTTGAAK